MRVSSAQPIIAAPRGQQPRPILQLIVLALNKRRIPGRPSTISNRSLVAVLRLKKACTLQSESEPTRRGRVDAGSASKGCLTLLALYLSTKLPSSPTWSVPTVGNRRGERLIIIGEVPVGHRKMRQNRYCGSDVDQGTYDGEPFFTYDEQCHARTLRPGQPSASATSPSRRSPA
jgi:hypothetical protein